MAVRRDTGISRVWLTGRTLVPDIDGESGARARIAAEVPERIDDALRKLVPGDAQAHRYTSEFEPRLVELANGSGGAESPDEWLEGAGIVHETPARCHGRRTKRNGRRA
jgi:hypothetical protein